MSEEKRDDAVSDEKRNDIIDRAINGLVRFCLENKLMVFLVLAGLVCVGVALTVLFAFGGWDYYRTAIGRRGYMDAHRLYEPGPDGERIYLDSAQIDAARPGVTSSCASS